MVTDAGDGLFEDDDGGLLPADWEMPPAVRARLGRTVGRQRVIAEADHVLVIVHRVPSAEETERRGCIAWRDPSGRWRAIEAVEGRVALRQVLDEYRATLASIDEALEAGPDIEACFRILERLSPIGRAARHVHGTLQEAREACPHDKAILDLRDQAYAVERRAELLSGDARFALERALARSSHEHTIESRRTADAGDRLNRLVALFLPAGTAAALLGMNVQSGLEDLTPPWPFVWVVLVCLVVGVMLRDRVNPRA